MQSKYILALDQGTTGSTAIIFDEDQKAIGKGYREIPQIYPQPGWVEHDPEDIFHLTIEAAKEAFKTARIQPNHLAAIGITNQRETTVIWDRKTSLPIANAIVWQCRRTSPTCDALRRKNLQRVIYNKTGLVIDPYFSATKIAWLLDHVPNARNRAQKGELAFGTMDSWLIWKLTDGKSHTTDYTNASRTLLFDIHEKKWSKDLCDIFNVPMEVIPNVLPSASDFGITTAHHFGASIPICGVAGDQQASLFGHGATCAEKAKCTFGTGAFVLSFTDAPVNSKNGLLCTLSCNEKGRPAYALEGSVFMAGAVVQWLRDGLALIRNAQETENIARSIPDSGGVLFVPAFVGLGAPYWDSEARAAILGMTRGTQKAHIVRAALESIAFQVADLIEAMEGDMGIKLKELYVDGGATSNGFLLQFLADLIGIPVVRPSMTEMTSFGAARLAAIHCGLWKTKKTTASETLFEPKISNNMRATLRKNWGIAVSRVRSHLPLSD